MLPAGCIRRRSGPPPAPPAARGLPSQPADSGRAGSPRAGPAPTRAAGLAAASTPDPLRARAHGLLTCASGRPARPQAASTPSGPARRGPTRPRPRSPRVGEEERRLRNRQPPPVPPPRRPAFPSSSGPRAAAAAVTNRSADLRATRSPLETGSAASQSPAVWRREVGARRGRDRRAWWAWRPRRWLQARSVLHPLGCWRWRAAA